MQTRPLVDYLSDDLAASETRLASTAGNLDMLAARLRELEARLAAPPVPVEEPKVVQTMQERSLSSQIETILKRRDGLTPPRPVPEQPDARHFEPRPRPEDDAPARRVTVTAPTLAEDRVQPEGYVPADVMKFAEAVHLIGLAADRFLRAADDREQPVRQPEPQPQAFAELATVTAVMQDAISAFRAIADDMAVSAAEFRHHATTRQQQVETRPEAAVRRIDRDDAELYRLQDDLDDLRDRLATLVRRRNRGRF